MSDEKEDVLRANSGSPAADIPHLKLKDKERKKAGVAWSAARGGASQFAGATGGNGGSAAGAVGMAAKGALLGKLGLAAAAFSMVAAAGVLGYGRLKGN